jgi:integrase
VLAVGTGLRLGEALALKWTDLDLDIGTVQVRHTLQRPTGRPWQLAPPKSKRARRTVHLPGFVVTALRGYRARQNRERLAAGAAWQNLDFAFTRAVDGHPLHDVSVTHRLQRALAKAGLPHQRFHDLRHAAASLLLAQGADMRIMEVLGHSSITLTANTYSHVGKAAMRDAADKMQRALG